MNLTLLTTGQITGLITGVFTSALTGAFALIAAALITTADRASKHRENKHWAGGSGNRSASQRSHGFVPRLARLDQRGEGVISAAIAVLIIASLGALMWVGFKSLWENAEATTNSEIAKIGQ